MITRDDGTIDYYSEGEYEAFVQAAVAIEDDGIEDEEEQVLRTHDTSPSLVVTKVLSTQPKTWKTKDATSSKLEPAFMEVYQGNH
jgi:hypothetical protein